MATPGKKLDESEFRAIARLLRDGLSTAAIARAVGVCRITVRKYAKQLIEKLPP